MRPPLLLLGALFVLASCEDAHSQGAPYPSVFLRTRVIDTQQEALRQQRRRLLGEPSVPLPPAHAHHTNSERWGALRGTHQWLVTHRPGLPQQQQAALLAHVEAAGCHLAHYLPDHTLVVVGPAHAAVTIEQHPHVLWMAPHVQTDKVAPEWQPVLLQLHEMQPQLQQLTALALQGGANGTAAARLAAAAVQEALSPASEWDAASGQLLVGAVVSFPGLASPGGQHRAAAGRLADHQQRIRRVMLEREQRDAGAAAAADWAEPLLQRFGAVISRASADHAMVLVPAGQLGAAVDWLAARPTTHWVAPAPKIRLSNVRASTISQSAKATSQGSSGIDPAFHPVWAAGITGQGQVVGCGDSGIDRFHCFFSDAAFASSAAWQAAVTIVDGIRTFDSTEHRKIRYHRAYGDTEDSNGHGTHVSGTLVGMPEGSTLEAEAPDGYIGMAPDAKIAFIDLADSSSDKIFTPSDLIGGYFSYTSAVGANIHSDSWGTNDIRYDYLAQQVDQYSWEQPDFLAVLPAGNDGQRSTLGTRSSGELTVTSPANSKNCLSVGATQTAGEEMETTAVRYSVWEATVMEGEYSDQFRVMQANFGGPVSSLTGGKELPVVVASPLDGCSPLQNSTGGGGAGMAGAVVLIQRGDCYFSQKALAAQDAGAAAVLLFDNVLGAYFVPKDDSASPVSIPVMAVTRRIGQQMVGAVDAGKALTMSFAASTPPSNSFENLASYSSQGPTLDYRVKPDILAPGTLTSAAVGDGSSQDCELMTMAGTSMATPVTASSAILLRQYFTDGFYPTGSKDPANAFTPTGALLKAVLLGGAATIVGFEADTGLPVDPPPSFRQGFGRVFLGNSVYLADSPSSRPLKVVDAVPITQGETHSYCIRASGGPLSITLVWTDYPAALTASKALVHDLDLTVRAAGLNGIPLLGNGGSVSDPSTPDRENNVEQVAWTVVPAGLVSITVTGASVPDAAGSPSYALVAVGDFTGDLTKPGTGGQAAQCTISVAAITSGPSGITSVSPVRFDFGTESGSSSGVDFQCRLGDGNGNITAGDAHHDWRSCTSPAIYASLPDGAYQFSVRADSEDIATNRNFVLDTTPPSVSLSSTSLQPGTTTDAATANVTWEGSDATGVSYSCTLQVGDTVPLQPPVNSGTSKMDMQEVTLGQPFNCTSPLVLHWLLPAAWSLQVVGQDLANNSADPLKVDWSVEYQAAAAPYTRFLSGPFGLQPKSNMSYVFVDLDASGQAAQTFTAHECWLEALGGGGNGAYADCSSPFVLPTDIQDGQYRFHARVAGTAGDSGSEAVASFQLDSIPPVVGITERPDAMVAAGATSASFNSSEEGSTFFCGLSRSDTGSGTPSAPAADAYYACSSPAALTNLTDGSYLFAVYAVDMVGNKGSPATAPFIADGTPPTITDVSLPSATSQPEFTVTFTASDSGSGINNVTCRFRALALADGGSASGSGAGSGGAAQGEWQLCSSPQAYSGLQEGRYGLTLRATDKAGLTTQTEEMEVVIDATPPVVSTASFPTLGEPVPSTVTFQLAELSSEPAGSYSNVSTYQTLVQTVADEVAFSDLQLAIQGGDSPSGAAGAVSQSGSSGQGRRRRSLLAEGDGGTETVLPASAVGTWTNCSAACTYKGLASGLYSLQVRAVDAAGNQGNASEPYPFEVDSSIGSTPFPLWAIIACAAGGTLVVGALAFLLWRCCCASKRKVGPPVGAVHSTTTQYTYSPGSQPYPAYSNGHSSGGYPPTPGSVNGGSGGAWGYPSQPSYANNGAVPAYAANGGYAGNGRAAPVPAITPDMDPVQAQHLALAAAASRRGMAAGPPLRSQPASGGGEEAEQRQMRLAIEASLQEQRLRAQREADDAQLRAAIEASLREQRSRG